MEFKEMFERYVQGVATEDEKRLVDEEIEKNELINDYLAQKLFELQPKSAIGDMEDSGKDIKHIRKYVNRKFMIFASVIIALVCVGALLMNFVFLPAYHASFYNPNEGSTDADFGRLYTNMNVYGELFYPGAELVSVSFQTSGLGRYNISAKYADLFCRDKEYVYESVMDKNVYYNSYVSPLELKPPGNIFYNAGTSNFAYIDAEGKKHSEQPETDKQSVLEKLARLPDYVLVRAYVSLGEDLSLEDLYSKKKRTNVEIHWAAFQHAPNKESGTDMGFWAGGPYMWYASEDSWVIENREKYPYLALYDGKREMDALTAADYEEHIREMLTYMIQEQEFIHRMTISSVNEFETALEYVNTYGIQIYGLVIAGRPSDILEFYENENVRSIVIDDAKLDV